MKMQRKKKLIDSKLLTEDQKLALKLQKFQTKGVLAGSKSMKNVENVMSQIYHNRQAKVIKYSGTKSESTLQKPLYKLISDNKKEIPINLHRFSIQPNANTMHNIFDVPEIETLSQPTISRHKMYHRTEHQEETPPKFIKMQSQQIFPTQPSQQFQQKQMVQSQQQINQTKTVINTIDSVEKLQQYEQNKKKVDVQVFRKLGIIDKKDKKLLQIRDLQARALKLRLKVNKEPIFSPSSLTTSLKIQFQNPGVKPNNFYKPERVKTAIGTTSMKGTLDAQRSQIKYLSSFVDCEYHFQNEVAKKNRPKTQNAKWRVLKFFDRIVTLENEQREDNIANKRELIQTIESMKNNMQSWHNSLMDRNDILEKNLTDTIKEQVIQYKSQQDQRLLHL